jgi:lipopolysaccharide transport system permease protein
MKSDYAIQCGDSAAPVSAERRGEGQWTTVIKPWNPWFKLDLLGIWRYRDLIWLFVRRDFVAQYKQTVLGPLWFFIQPLFTSLVFTVVFGKIAKIPTDGIPNFLFFLAGSVCWGYFAESLNKSSSTFIDNAHIFGKVYFPRLVIPLAIVISNIFKFLLQFGLFLAFWIYFYQAGAEISITRWALLLPFLILQMALLGIGCGILVSSLTTKYRDLSLVVGFGVQLWMYATPVVYPLSQIPHRFRVFFAFNPMTSVVETFRLAFLGTSSISVEYIAIGWIVTLLLLFAGLILFTRIEKTFMDTV